jgi:hypothetical protein
MARQSLPLVQGGAKMHLLFLSCMFLNLPGLIADLITHLKLAIEK